MKKRGCILRAVVLIERPFCSLGAFSSIWRHFLFFTMKMGKEEGVLLASSGYKAKDASKHPASTDQTPTTKKYSAKCVEVQTVKHQLKESFSTLKRYTQILTSIKPNVPPKSELSSKQLRQRPLDSSRESLQPGHCWAVVNDSRYS